VQIGAILTLAARTGNETDSADSPLGGNRRRKRFLTNVPDAKLELLGKSLLDRTISRLRQVGIEDISVIPESSILTQFLPIRASVPKDFIAAWESSVGNYVRQGMDTLLLLRTSTYSDLNFEDLLRFHTERGAMLTQVYAADRSIDIAVVNANLLRDADGACRKALSALIPEQERFCYDGYVNHLNKAQDFRRLIEDALTGNCNLRPHGTEVSPGIWFGEGADIDDSCVINGPAFIGAGTHIAPCCNINGGSAIERNCEVDCGTTVEESWILQETYIGLGLNVRRSIVSNQRMIHLDRKTEIAITDPRLIRATKSFSLAEMGTAVLNKGQMMS
jgi:NDP-sugar pyrophosphorylase family protein